jgi:CRP/FNR family transcriptional regulator, anaerobic regulatory protein
MGKNMNGIATASLNQSNNNRVIGALFHSDFGADESIFDLHKSLCDLDAGFHSRRVKAGQWIYSSDTPCNDIYVVFAGCVKTLTIDAEGVEQIIGFQQKGELVGADGLANGHYSSHAVAITDCNLLVIPSRRLRKIDSETFNLARWVQQATCQELSKRYVHIGVIGTLSAEARVARFLCSLSEKFSAMGFSAHSFNLPMTRRDIGNYLGLTLETTSRCFTALVKAGLISSSLREVELLDIAALKATTRSTYVRAENKPVKRLQKVPLRFSKPLIEHHELQVAA